MAYYDWGDQDNPNVVLCVHGLTRNGRDFDALAQHLLKDYRVICPDVVGRGLSDRLANPNFYAVGQYVSDMVTLLAKIQPQQLNWVGTSMGGLIGMAYAGAVAGAAIASGRLTPAQVHQAIPDVTKRIDKLILNDVGPHIEAASLVRIGEYVGTSVQFDSFKDAVEYMRTISTSFGPHSDDQWQALTEFYFIESKGKWIKHYDLSLSVPFKTMTPEMAEQGEQILWASYSSLKAPVLIVRGKDSDLLSVDTLAKMLAINPQAQSVQFDGVGHAPTLMHTDQIDAVKGFIYAD